MAYGDGDTTYDSSETLQPPRRSMYAPSDVSKVLDPFASAGLPNEFPTPGPSVAPNPPDLGRPAPPPGALTTNDHMAPQSPLDMMLGKYNDAENAYKGLLEKGPEQFKPSIWRRLAGAGLGTLAGMGGGRQGYGRYSSFSSNPAEAQSVARGFTYGPQAKNDAEFKRQLAADQVGVDEASKQYQMLRQQGMDDLQARNIASEIESRNKPQIVEGYRVDQSGGPATAIPIAGLPEQLGPGQATNLPEVLQQKEQAPLDARAQAEADREKFAQEQQGRSFDQQNAQLDKRLAAEAERDRNRKTGDAQLERSYQFHTKEFDTIGKPIQDRSDRLQRLQISLRQNSPAADALVAPELLTAMAGGQGSGLRMNEAEIARIVGSTNNWQQMKSALDKWKTDPSKPFQIQPAQRGQFQALIDAMTERVQGKQQLLNSAQQRLADATDPASHKQLLAEVRQRMANIDNIEDAVAKDPAGRTVYKSQGKYIYSDGSEYKPPQNGQRQ
jgi:hypothetical protein